MMRKLLTPPIFLVLTSLLHASRISAQNLPPESAPRPPYVAPLASNAHWIVSLKCLSAEKRSQSAVAEYPDTIETVQSGNIRMTTMRYGGTRKITYYTTERYLFIHEDQKQIQLKTLVTSPPPYPLYTNEYQLIPELAAETYKGREVIEGRKCFHYATANGLDIYVDEETHLPNTARTSDLIAKFQFFPPPSTLLTLPAEEAALLKRQQRALKAFQAMR